jgi:hypothetical protein
LAGESAPWDGSYPAQLFTGRVGYFANLESVAESLHK